MSTKLFHRYLEETPVEQLRNDGLYTSMKKAAGTTYHEGANDERTVFLSYFRRQKRKYPDTAVGEIEKRIQDENIAWALRRNERYNAKPGGLGRK